MKKNFEKPFKFKSIPDLFKFFRTEQDCIDYLTWIRWKGKVVSPFDPTSKVYTCKNNRYHCKNTGKYFNAKTRTIFENSKISLKDWFLSSYLLFSDVKGISSRKLARSIGVTQKTAWFVSHRWRNASDIPMFKELLKGVVEVDETFVGGENKNRHWDKKAPYSQATVLVMRERKGKVISQVAPNKGIEYDFIYSYQDKKIGISAKRTTRERWKQNWAHCVDLEVDVMFLITLGTDLNETKAQTVLSYQGWYIIVAKEIYDDNKYLKNIEKVFSSEKVKNSFLKFLI